MITNHKKEQLLAIAKKLLDRSVKNEVLWEEHASIRGRQSTNYRVRFPTWYVYLYFVSPPTEPDAYVFGIADHGNREIMELFSEASDDDDTEFALLQSLYVEAERYVTGWDKAIAEIDRVLNTEGRIGKVDSPRVTTPPAF